MDSTEAISLTQDLISWLAVASLVLLLAALTTKIFALLAGDAVSLTRWVRCVTRSQGHAVARKSAMGGFHCVDCGLTGGDLEDFGQGTGDMSPGWLVRHNGKTSKEA